jgi:hypothetical protein
MKTMTAKNTALLVLFGRTLLFVFMQAIFAFGYFLAGSANAWERGAAWWPLGVVISNLICLFALVGLYRAEGRNYWDIFRIHRESIGGDLLAMLGFLIVAGPLGFFPNILLANALFENSQTVLDLLVRPLPLWAALASIAFFPVTQGLVEIALYFSYVMPRLDARPFPNLRPVLLPALMLGLQHLALPLLFNPPFMVWRGLMFVPFAFAVGVAMHWRPRLLPYIAIVHVLMDLSFALMFLPVAN